MNLARIIAKWRRLGATSLVLRPGERSISIVPATRSDALAEVCDSADAVEAYQETALIGVWRRPPDPPAPVDAASLQASAFAAQAAFLKEVMGLQTSALRSVREAMEVHASLKPSDIFPRAHEDDGDGQASRDDALLAALMGRGQPQPPPEGNGT